jgi:hypothetical protein
MFYKKIETTDNQSIGFIENKNILTKSLNDEKLLYTFVNLNDNTTPYGNLFKSFKFPITQIEKNNFTNKYINTALEYFSDINTAIVVEIPKGEYGELIDGKTFSLKIPQNIDNILTSTTLYGTYFGYIFSGGTIYNIRLNNQVSERHPEASTFGSKPTTLNDNNSNITFLFSNDIKPPKRINGVETIFNEEITYTTNFVFPFTLNPDEQVKIAVTTTNLGGGTVSSIIFDTNATPSQRIKFNTDFQKINGVGSQSLTMTYTGNDLKNKTLFITVEKTTKQTLSWDIYSNNNKFPTNFNGNGKRFAHFDLEKLNNVNYQYYDKPVGILYQDKGFAVITDPTLISNFEFSAGTSSGFNNIVSGGTYTGDTNFIKIYFTDNNISNCSYKSILTEYVQNVFCLANPNEFIGTTNSTYEEGYDENTTEKPIFITSIGLYNKYGELVGIAKLSEPIKKTSQSILPVNIQLKI